MNKMNKKNKKKSFLDEYYTEEEEREVLRGKEFLKSDENESETTE